MRMPRIAGSSFPINRSQRRMCPRRLLALLLAPPPGRPRRRRGRRRTRTIRSPALAHTQTILVSIADGVLRARALAKRDRRTQAAESLVGRVACGRGSIGRAGGSRGLMAVHHLSAPRIAEKNGRQDSSSCRRPRAAGRFGSVGCAVGCSAWEDGSSSRAKSLARSCTTAHFQTLPPISRRTIPPICLSLELVTPFQRVKEIHSESACSTQDAGTACQWQTL